MKKVREMPFRVGFALLHVVGRNRVENFRVGQFRNQNERKIKIEIRHDTCYIKICWEVTILKGVRRRNLQRLLHTSGESQEKLAQIWEQSSS